MTIDNAITKEDSSIANLDFISGEEKEGQENQFNSK
jgi:hypothetical protein